MGKHSCRDDLANQIHMTPRSAFFPGTDLAITFGHFGGCVHPAQVDEQIHHGFHKCPNR
jgi:hypothetical protein